MNIRSTLAFSPGAAGPFLKEAGQRERPPVWTESAVCAEVDPELFFPEIPKLGWPAKIVCAQCTVQRDCLLAALGRREEFGIWGGVDEIERRHLGPSPSPEAITAALAVAGKKTCGDCGEEKYITSFRREGGDTWSGDCKDCLNRAARERRAAA